MIKNKILKILVIVAFCASLVSCKDTSGDYVGQFYTDSQKEYAIKTCLSASCDSAMKHLFENEGFYNYNDGIYRITFPSTLKSVEDTLLKYNESQLIDSLVVSTNRMAVSCGTQIAPYFKKAIDTLYIIDADYLLKGGDNAITNYFILNEKDYLKSALNSPVSIRMNILGVNNVWNEIVNKFYQLSNSPITLDYQNYVIEKMLNGIFEEMKKEEKLIRTDETHRNDNMEIFGTEVYR